MTEQQQKTATYMGAGGVMLLASLVAALQGWEKAQGAFDWVLLNARVIFGSARMETAFYAVGIGTAFGLFWPWLLPAHFSTERAKASVRVLSCLVTFTAAVSMHQTTAGIRDAVFLMLAGPMLAEFLIRRWCGWRKLPLPKSLQ